MNIDKAAKRIVAKNKLSLVFLEKIKDREYHRARMGKSYRRYNKHFNRAAVCLTAYYAIFDREPKISFNVKGALSGPISGKEEGAWVDYDYVEDTSWMDYNVR